MYEVREHDLFDLNKEIGLEKVIWIRGEITS